MFDCCLISLPKPYLKQPDAQAPMGLLYVAAALEKAGYGVSLWDAQHAPDPESLPAARLYGITATAMEIGVANRYAKALRHRSEAPIVLGGPGVFATDAIWYDIFDAVSYGDGEMTILSMMKDLDSGARLAPVYKSYDITEIDAYSFPARHLLSHQGGNIFAYNYKYAEGDSTIILSSRGCAYHCAFCAAPKIMNGRKIRFRAPEEVAREIREVKERFGVQQFRFSDDMWTASKERTLDLCRVIGEENIFWRISCRVHPLDDDMLDAMYQAGCRELSFGIESFDDTILQGLHKGTTARMNYNALCMAAKHGFKVRALLMIRTPFQTPKTILINKQFLRNAPWDIAACTAFLPIPGCAIADHPERYGVRILDTNMDHYNFYMYGPSGRLPIPRVISIEGRDIDEFHEESEEFRDWLEHTGKTNRG